MILRQMVTSVSFAVPRSDWMLPGLLVFMLATQDGLETGASRFERAMRLWPVQSRICNAVNVLPIRGC